MPSHHAMTLLRVMEQDTYHLSCTRNNCDLTPNGYKLAIISRRVHTRSRPYMRSGIKIHDSPPSEIVVYLFNLSS
eukprot:scaffold147829_cov30-Tisochrysis_lutea.AAC.4